MQLRVASVLISILFRVYWNMRKHTLQIVPIAPLDNQHYSRAGKNSNDIVIRWISSHLCFLVLIWTRKDHEHFFLFCICLGNRYEKEWRWLFTVRTSSLWVGLSLSSLAHCWMCYWFVCPKKNVRLRNLKQHCRVQT